MTVAGGLLALMATVIPVVAAAQPRLRVTTALELGQMHDDNLFATPAAGVRRHRDAWRTSRGLATPAAAPA